MDKNLKQYLEDNFDFKALKKEGFFSKEIHATDYEKQATRICEFFNLKNIYDWSLRKPIINCPTGMATGEFKNLYGEDILKTISNQ